MQISGVVMPTVPVLGERHRLPGRRVLEDAVAGYEAGLRIGKATPSGFHARGFHATGVCGMFTARPDSASGRRDCPQHHS